MVGPTRPQPRCHEWNRQQKARGGRWAESVLPQSVQTAKSSRITSTLPWTILGVERGTAATAHRTYPVLRYGTCKQVVLFEMDGTWMAHSP